MGWYKSGTVAVSNGGKNVTGTGTAFVDNVQLGDGLLGPDGRVYEIDSITSATGLVLTSNYQGASASAQSYAVVPTQNLVKDLAGRVVGLLNQYGDVASNAGTGKFAAGTLAAPSVRGITDENTGVQFAGSDVLRLITGGVTQLQIAANGTPTGPATTLMPVSTAQRAEIDKMVPLSAGLTRATIAIAVNSDLNSLTDASGGGFYTLSGAYLNGPVASLTGVLLVLRRNFDAGAGVVQKVFISAQEFTRMGAAPSGTWVWTEWQQSASGGVNADIRSLTRLTTSYATTTASAANVFITSAGELQRSTSSEKYKTSVEDLDAARAAQVLDFRPVWYRSTCEGDRPDWGWYGLIAEEIGEVAPQYVHWAQPLKTVQREELQSVEVPTGVLDDNGQPVLRTEQQSVTITEQVPDDAAPLQAEGVMYERLVVPLLWHVQQLTARVAALEAAQAPAAGAA